MNDEPRSTILIVEDDRATRTFLAENLAADGYAPLAAATAREGLRLLESAVPDLAIIDLGLPDRDGLELLDEVRTADALRSRVDPQLPLLVLSGRSGEVHRLRSFERGADDVLQKPFGYVELRARIVALLRRSGDRRRHGRLRAGTLELDPTSCQVLLNGRPLSLSHTEFTLLRTLASDPARVFTKDELLRDVWGYGNRTTTRTLDSHACRLRQKLARDGDRLVVNVWGVGYRLIDGLVTPEPLGDEATA
jgi:DNA-binding response OmpR family regulator